MSLDRILNATLFSVFIGSSILSAHYASKAVESYRSYKSMQQFVERYCPETCSTEAYKVKYQTDMKLSALCGSVWLLLGAAEHYLLTHPKKSKKYKQ